MLNNFVTFGFSPKNSIDKVLEIIPKESGNVITFDLWPKFQGQAKVT
jgi:hypothetical protein